MKRLIAIPFAALMGVSAVALISTSASAEIVCNDEGDCWHVHTEYHYRPEFGLVIHPDDWKWKEGDRYHWREHEGRGYWKGDTWTDF
jgi:hypothetical protein